MVEISTAAVQDRPLTASDLLKLGYADDPMLLEDMSLCKLCTLTCSVTVKPN